MTRRVTDKGDNIDGDGDDDTEANVPRVVIPRPIRHGMMIWKQVDGQYHSETTAKFPPPTLPHKLEPRTRSPR